MTIMIAANIFDRINVLMADGLQIKSLFNGKYMRKKLAFRYNIESFTFFLIKYSSLLNENLTQQLLEGKKYSIEKIRIKIVNNNK